MIKKAGLVSYNLHSLRVVTENYAVELMQREAFSRRTSPLAGCHLPIKGNQETREKKKKL